MANGTVTWCDDPKWIGFVEQEDGPDVAVHLPTIDGDDFKALEEGHRVSFDIEQGQKGLAAANVTVI